MEKLKLSDLDKFVLLHRANHCIRSSIVEYHDYRASSGMRYSFISPLECEDVRFRCGVFSKRNGARVEVIYKYHNCRVILLWHYTLIKFQDLFYEDYVYVPKSITIEREFNSSLLISIVPWSEDNHIYIYNSTKSIHDLCEGEEEGAVPAIASVEAEDDGNRPKLMNL